ncbi:hypothetical protein A2907_01595 [Candidatus Azambacteria bacterium RIFCSPLOWO2_01_FULL_37_9]|uniref:Signal-peptide peptidase, presenilin aspartyl protease n=1 Tax=Candidatus Azambacteria bacterium RIFCSPLOWO2_01_FULL_37_9 TaxID=1797297 RepID=A0A1F5C7C0_9BACT|nr:MAG: hypothetical protein US06_C0004G0029 [Parcubacteria group bacterium GW2011_GWC2_36_17]OGD38745.1 MAG: hypothetical protein A2907_01595 [Candidatus Azambacteria bacterium RIFCSPLOWO2_01_FULL_37_9]
MQKFLQYFKTELFLQELALFSIAQFLGIFLARRVDWVMAGAQITAEQISVSDFVIYFLIGTVLIFALSQKSRISGFLMNIFFVFTLFLGASFFFSFFINQASAFYFSVALIIARFVFPSIFLHNFLFLLSISSFSSILALQMTPTVIVILLAALAVYDIVSVYLTGHMVKMAKTMIERHLIFGFIIPEKIKYNFWGVQKAKPGQGVVFLGGGDVGLPIFLVANVAASNLTGGIIVALFAVLGMILSYYLFVSQKFKKPMPALPPISMMTILGYLIIQVLGWL